MIMACHPAGAETIEHGDFVDEEIALLMKEHHVTFILPLLL